MSRLNSCDPFLKQIVSKQINGNAIHKILQNAQNLIKNYMVNLAPFGQGVATFMACTYFFGATILIKIATKSNKKIFF